MTLVERASSTVDPAPDETAVRVFRAGLRGEVLRRDDAAYDAARKVFDGMIDRRPALIARCTGAADVVAGVRFAREHHLPLSVRGVVTVWRARRSAKAD